MKISSIKPASINVKMMNIKMAENIIALFKNNIIITCSLTLRTCYCTNKLILQTNPHCYQIQRTSTKCIADNWAKSKLWMSNFHYHVYSFHYYAYRTIVMPGRMTGLQHCKSFSGEPRWSKIEQIAQSSYTLFTDSWIKLTQNYSLTITGMAVAENNNYG